MTSDKKNDGVRPNSREEADDTRKTDDQDCVLTTEEHLDEGLRDSMDASDPPSVTQPGNHGDPVPSSGYSEEDEAAAAAAKPV